MTDDEKAECRDVLSERERKIIHQKFFRSQGQLNNKSAVISFFASLGQTISESDLVTLLPRSAHASDETDESESKPLGIQDVLAFMRRRKEDHLILSTDDDESLSTFVALGGAIDGTGEANIDVLVQTVEQLRSLSTQDLRARSPANKQDSNNDDSPTSNKRKKSVLFDSGALRRAQQEESRRSHGDAVHDEMSASFGAATESRAFLTEDDDAGGPTLDTFLQTRLKQLPSRAKYGEFVEAVMFLRSAAANASLREGRSGNPYEQVTVGTPCEEDLSFVPNALEMSVADGTSKGEFLRASIAKHRGTFALARSTISHVTNNNNNNAQEEEWSDGEVNEINCLDEEEISAAVKRSIDRTVEMFQQKRTANTPTSLLNKIFGGAQTRRPLEVMTPEGIVMSDVIAARKQHRQVTKPITPVMLIREEIKQSILVLEVDAKVRAQMESLKQGQTHQQTRPSTAPLRRAGEGQQRPSSATSRYLQPSTKHNNDANDFVEKIAKRVDYIERTSRRYCGPSSNVVNNTAKAAKLRAQRVVELRQRNKCVNKLQEARESALEWAIEREVKHQGGSQAEAEVSQEAPRPTGSAMDALRQIRQHRHATNSGSSQFQLSYPSALAFSRKK